MSDNERIMNEGIIEGQLNRPGESMRTKRKKNQRFTIIKFPGYGSPTEIARDPITNKFRCIICKDSEGYSDPYSLSRHAKVHQAEAEADFKLAKKPEQSPLNDARDPSSEQQLSPSAGPSIRGGSSFFPQRSLPIVSVTSNAETLQHTPPAGSPSFVKEENEEIEVPLDCLEGVIDLTHIDEDEADDELDISALFSIDLDNEYSVVSHTKHNFRALGIFIHTLLKVIVCIDCRRAIEPRTLHEHALRHNPHHNADPDVADQLIKEYGLVPMTNVPYPTSPINPVMFIVIEPIKVFFCSTCHRGYRSGNSLSVHQSTSPPCHKSQKDGLPSHYRAYGQGLTRHKNRRLFPVDIGVLKEQRQQTTRDHSLLFEKSLPPIVDYSKMPIKPVTDRQNLSAFFAREGWMEPIGNHTTADIMEATRPAREDEKWGIAIQKASHKHLADVQNIIDEFQGFGMTKLMAQFHPTESSASDFSHITKPTQVKYGNLVARLLFNIIRCNMKEGWHNPIQYPPLDNRQLSVLIDLRYAVSSENEEMIQSSFQRSLFVLYGHLKMDYTCSANLGKFFSAVNVFIVFLSLDAGGNFKLASVSTGHMAALEYSIRATMGFEIARIRLERNISMFDAFQEVKMYLQSMQESPMSFIGNGHKFFKTVRSHEISESDFIITDANGREVSYNGKLIRLKDIKTMHDRELERYNNFIQQRIFFGEDIPKDLFPKYKIEDLVDNISNNAVGYSFIDDPRNNFSRYRGSYGKWLLSDRDRANKFVYYVNGELRWHSKEVLNILRDLEESRGILAPGGAFSCVLQTRGEEYARLLLRNATGSSRNLRIEHHMLNHVAIQDKTSHQFNIDHYVPHTFTREWSHAIIDHLVLFRPFEEIIAESMLSPEILHVYRFNLWPGLRKALTGDHFREHCKDITENYMGIALGPKDWRSLMTAFAKRLPRSLEFNDNREFFLHKAMMHSSKMSIQKYGRTTEEGENSNYQTVIGCIQACLDFHKHIGIGQANPYVLFKVQAADDVNTSVDGGSHSNPLSDLSFVEKMTKELSVSISEKLEDVVKENILNSLAEGFAAYLPRSTRKLDDNNLRTLSDIHPHPSRLQSLRIFLKDSKAKFTCPEQAVLLELMCQGKESILGILGTNRGKTTTVLHYAQMHQHLGITVVVLPLSTLHDDFARRAREKGVSTARWTVGGKYNQDVAILHVSIEHMSFEPFQRDLKTLKHKKRLNLIVFDEIHKVLTDRSYRDCMNDFWALNLVNTPIVGLDGSIPPETLPEFFKVTNTSWRVIRTPSTRPELYYDIKRVDNDIIDTIAADVLQITSNYGPQDRLMVFCRSREDVGKLAEALGVPPVSAETREDNVEHLKNWREGKYKVMVSTSIMGCGLDYPSVRHVLHFNIAYTMIAQHQQESRAGRDGKPATAITYVKADSYQKKNDTDKYGLSQLKDWVSEKEQCLRIIPSSYIDGVPVTCTLLPECVFCSFCSSQMYDTAPSTALRLAIPPSTPIPETQTQVVLRTPISVQQKTLPAIADTQTTYRFASPTSGIPNMPSRTPTSAQPLYDSYTPITPSTYEPSPMSFDNSLTTRENSTPSFQLSQKRQNENENKDNSANKRLRGQDYTRPSALLIPRENSMADIFSLESAPTARSSTAGFMTFGEARRSAPGMGTRLDAAYVKQSRLAFENEIRIPVYRAIRQLQDMCIVCVCLQNDGHRGHNHEGCVQDVASWKKDQQFKDFKAKFKYPDGFCYGCGLDGAQFPHESNDVYGTNCIYRGHIVRLLYLFSRGNLEIFEGYPISEKEFKNIQNRNNFSFISQWACSTVANSEYVESKYYNIYRLIIWVMESLSVRDL